MRSSRALTSLLLLLLASGCGLVRGCSEGFDTPVAMKGVRLETEGLLLRPESERFLDFFLIGLSRVKTDYFMLPKLKSQPGISGDLLEQFGEELYWLDFELSHGGIMRHIPPNTNVFVGVPGDEAARERKLFSHYLEKRCGWAPEDIEARIHYFAMPDELIWVQDAGEILGRDSQNRAVIRVDITGRPEFKRSIQALVDAYPESFQLKETAVGVRAEGGDEELVWLPGQQLGLMVGRARVNEYLATMHSDSHRTVAPQSTQVEEARRAFAASFYNLPVVFVPQAVLDEPALGSPDLFHMDMVVAVMSNGQHTHAFVPTFIDNPVDAMLWKPLKPELVTACQREYDVVAKQMADLGYEVVRLPFGDHPVRGPANVVKYRDKQTGEYVVMLGKYPYHYPPDQKHPQSILFNALADLEDDGGRWQAEPSPRTESQMKTRMTQVWQAIDEVSAAPNPIFDRQKELFEQAGYRVDEVPVYPWGSGGLHCQVLR